MKIAIIGGGITGICTAYLLSKEGFKVTLFEKEKELGGLARTFRWGKDNIEENYHHIYSNDIHTYNLLKELGLNLKWKYIDTAFFSSNKLYPFSTTSDILKYPNFRFLDIIRFGIASMYASYIVDWKKIEKKSAVEWLNRLFGRKVYLNIWEPLLKLKFGKDYRKISAAWVQTRIKRRVLSKKGKKEKFGYIEGSFKRLIDRLEEKIISSGGKCIKKAEVRKLVVKDGKFKGLLCNGKKYNFDKVVVSVPYPILNKMLPSIGGKISYSAIVSTILRLDKPLSKNYWVNIGDDKLPFVALIEYQNLNNHLENNILYIPHYVSPGSKIYSLSNKKILEMDIKALKRIFKGFNAGDIKDYKVFKDKYGSAIYTKGYADIIPSITTSIKGLYLATNAQIYPEDRGANKLVELSAIVTDIIKKNKKQKKPIFFAHKRCVLNKK